MDIKNAIIILFIIKHYLTTIMAAPPIAIKEGFLRKNKNEMRSTSGIPSKNKSDWVSPGVCGCAMAIQKLPEPLKRPIAISAYHFGVGLSESFVTC